MTKVLGDYYPRSISQYTPNMEFAADVVEGTHIVSLGAPAALDADGIWDGVTVGTSGGDIHTSANYKTTFDGSSTSLTTTAGQIDATYGRCLTCTGNASTDQVVTIIGRDYLGQGIEEDFTLSGTTVLFGKKAFKYVDSTSCTAGTGGSTLDVGWYNRLGLPYKAEKVISYTEDDVSFPVDPVAVSVEVDGTRYAAGTDVVVPSPVAGQITEVHSVVTTATSGVSTGTVVVGSTDVGGLSIVIANSASVADLDSDTATSDDDQTTSTIAKHGAIGISPNSTPTGGAANYTILVEPILFIAGPDTDPQTATTTDPRGSIRCTTACDGSIVYEVSYMVDATDLHGVEHYNG